MTTRFDIKKVLSFWSGFDSVLFAGPARSTAVPRAGSYIDAIRRDAQAVACDAKRVVRNNPQHGKAPAAAGAR